MLCFLFLLPILSQHHINCGDEGKIPEEFFGCSDVQLTTGSGAAPKAPAADAADVADGADADKPSTDVEKTTEPSTTEAAEPKKDEESSMDNSASDPVTTKPAEKKAPSSSNKDTAAKEAEAGKDSDQAPTPPKYNRRKGMQKMGGGGENCVAMGEFCAGKKCCNSAKCSRVSGDGKVGEVCN